MLQYASYVGSSAATPVQKPHRTRRKAPASRKSSFKDGGSYSGGQNRIRDDERADGGDSDSSLVQEFSAEWDRIKMSNNYGKSESSLLLHADSGFESGSPVDAGQVVPKGDDAEGEFHNQRDGMG